MAHDHEHPHDHTEPPEEIALRVKALESLLTEKGLVDPAALDELIDTYEHRIGPRNGALVVAKAWTTLIIRLVFLPMVPGPLRNWVFQVCRGKT